MRTIIKKTIDKIDEEVVIKGWINSRRDMGKIAFIDVRDYTGLLQVVLVPSELDEVSKVNKDSLREEFVVEIHGIIQKRGEKQINPNMLTGQIEVLAKQVKILSKAKTTPFEITKNTINVSEELRLKYRYLDLRSERMKNNLILRHKVINFIRNELIKKDFIEIETPYITKGTPEGAREFIVPARQHAGKCYVLPQSPQQFKQLLQVAGFERYFQIARCFRDEDQRGDRQPEFTQFDLEASFLSREDILNLTEDLMIKLVKELVPNKKIIKTPFPKVTYKEAIQKYKTDKPDIRENKNDPDELAFLWVVDFPLFEYSKTEDKLVSSHHPFTRPKDEDIENLDKNPLKVNSYAYDLVLNGYEVGGGSIRIHEKDLQNKIFKILGLYQEEIQEKFGHMLEAFEYGVPPHGGIAPGIDRLVMLLAGEPNIREIIAFPKTSDAKDLMMNAPSILSGKSIEEANINFKNKK